VTNGKRLNVKREKVTYLFLDTLHVLLDVGDHRRSDIESLGLIPLATARRNRRTVLLGILDVAQNLVSLTFRDQGTERCRLVGRLHEVSAEHDLVRKKLTLPMADALPRATKASTTLS
jgi:hypothetical protein